MSGIDTEPTKEDMVFDTNENDDNIFEDTIRGMIHGIFIGDSLAMPVHWYYNIKQLKRDFGKKGITKYEKSVHPFKGSIMNLSDTGGGGRGNDKGTIIGDIINHGKKKYW
eukprot:CAMPEP_0114658364 /NCGR_PEP_ID=MMETSP0191-20121206/15618_1 /TAXON_ID=126664 /ORGANISM="Sorites sp." /LENGTH=109 /DNA_ID=CAMNT_0001880201 /DNA_START=39 /DNA_END=365 /DNA_ORIENTATION=+